MNDLQKAIKELAEANGMTVVVEQNGLTCADIYDYSFHGTSGKTIFNKHGKSIGAAVDDYLPLFMAAPELLEAAKSLISAWEFPGVNMKEPRSVLINAIQQAEGE